MKKSTIEITIRRYQELLEKEKELIATEKLVSAINDAFAPDCDED